MLTADPADAVVDLTRQLVAFDSVNPGLVQGAAGEGPIAQFAAERLSELHAVAEWVDLAQLRRSPMAVAGAVGRFLAG